MDKDFKDLILLKVLKINKDLIEFLRCFIFPIINVYNSLQLPLIVVALFKSIYLTSNYKI